MQHLICLTEVTITAQHDFNTVKRRAFFRDPAKAMPWAEKTKAELVANDEPEWADYFVIETFVHDFEDA